MSTDACKRKYSPRLARVCRNTRLPLLLRQLMSLKVVADSHMLRSPAIGYVAHIVSVKRVWSVLRCREHTQTIDGKAEVL